jgi:hypothetical protein
MLFVFSVCVWVVLVPNVSLSLLVCFQSDHLAVLYCNLGAVFLRMSRLKEAETACQRGKDLASSRQSKMGFSMAEKCLAKVKQVRDTSAASVS